MSEKKIGERIRLVRKNTGCNQKEFGSLLNIPQSTLSAYETGRMQPTVTSLINIAKKFNVSLDWLCGIENNPDKRQRKTKYSQRRAPYNTHIRTIRTKTDIPSSEDKSGTLSDELKAALDEAEKDLQELATKRGGERICYRKQRSKGG